MNLGDRHNFGKMVRRDTIGWISKPRTIFWEWIFLSDKSPLRRHLEESLSEAGIGGGPFATLSFIMKNCPQEGGFVEEHRETPVGELDCRDSVAIGKAIGIAMYFGITDLHLENVHFSRTDTLDLLVTPIDIESVFNVLELPSQTHLTPELSSKFADFGLRPLLSGGQSYRIPIAPMIWGFIHCVEALNRVAQKTAKILGDEISRIGQSPRIRQIPRPSQFYFDRLSDSAPTMDAGPPLQPSEIGQLARGDIPYYFKKHDDPTLYWEASADSEPSALQEEVLLEGLLPGRNPSLAWVLDKKRIGIAALEILRALEPFSHVGSTQYKSLVISRTVEGLEV